MALGRPKEAVEPFQKAVNLSPKYPEYQSNLGVALVGADKPQQAIEHFQEAVRLKPSYADAYANAAEAYAKLDQPQAAISAAEKAIALAESTKHFDQARDTKSWLDAYRAKLSTH